MNKLNIERELQKHDTTVLSFPERGPWGDSKYRGNCSGWIHAFLIWKYRVQKMFEVFAGSGTGYDVAKDMGIQYVGVDLNPKPVRPGIIPLDAFADIVPEDILGTDMVFMHPPYMKEIGIPYAGSMYPDPTNELAAKDIGQMPWEQGMAALNSVVTKYFSAMDPGARMSILMGDVRRNGRCRSMLNDIVKPGELEQVIIKMQHNCVSNGQTYAHKMFVPIVHEYILVVKKPEALLFAFQLPQTHKVDARDIKITTWRDVVKAVLYALGGSGTLKDIYDAVEGHKKCESNKYWKDKIRQTLNCDHQTFYSTQRGIWALNGG